MEYDRKRAYGKLSELVGESGLVNDEFMGKLNLVSNVKDDFDQLDTSAKEMYVAYSQGVNAYLNTKDTLPIEFELINLTMDPWQPWDSLAVFKVRHIMMGVFEGKIWRSSLLKEFNIDKLVNLFRGYEKIAYEFLNKKLKTEPTKFDENIEEKIIKSEKKKFIEITKDFFE